MVKLIKGSGRHKPLPIIDKRGKQQFKLNKNGLANAGFKQLQAWYQVSLQHN